MSDTVVAKGSDSKFKIHPDGQFVGQCVDCIDLGDRVEEFKGKQKLSPKCALVFRTGERNEEIGEFIDIAREFTVSMGDKSNLRKFLEQWRGKPYTSEQAEAGVPLHKLTGQHGLLTISHKVSSGGRAYANITACVGIPKQMQHGLGDYTADYLRADFWAERKKEYAQAAAKFRADNATSGGSGDDPTPGDDDSGLPF